VPAKVRLRESVARLGEVLAEQGVLDFGAIDGAVAGAKRLGILLGEYLVGHDLVSRDALASGLEGQLLRRIGHAANMAPELEYAFYRDVDLLSGWSGEVVLSHPLNAILASVRHWTDRARVRATLNRIGKHPLAVHNDSDLTNIAVSDAEQVVLEAIRGQMMTLAELESRGIADDDVIASLVYVLAVTRQFAFKGQKKGPMAARGPAWRSVAPGGSPSTPGMRVSVGASTPPGIPAAAPVPPPSAPPPRTSATSASRPPGGSSPRAMAPAARPASLASRAPQIRPIARRGESASKVAAELEVKPDPEDSDDAKTIARSSPLALPTSVRAPRSGEGGGPSSALSSFRLAEAALQRNDLAAAEDFAAKALAVDPTQPDYVVLRAWISALRGGPAEADAAIVTLSGVLSADGQNQRALLIRGRLLARASRPKEALADFKALLALSPQHREAENELRQLIRPT
jgi:hypothetical protein